jgi:hypothetical protein
MIIPDEVWTKICVAHAKAGEAHLEALKSLRASTTRLSRTAISKLAELQLALDEANEILTIVTQENTDV